MAGRFWGMRKSRNRGNFVIQLFGRRLSSSGSYPAPATIARVLFWIVDRAAEPLLARGLLQVFELLLLLLQLTFHGLHLILLAFLFLVPLNAVTHAIRAGVLNGVTQAGDARSATGRCCPSGLESGSSTDRLRRCCRNWAARRTGPRGSNPSRSSGSIQCATGLHRW